MDNAPAEVLEGCMVEVSKCGTWQHGYKVTRKNENSEWRKVPHSDYVKNLKTFWFQKSPHNIMLEDIGIETTVERANNFAAASDNNADVWYYLGVACSGSKSDEALKWIMGAVAAELKVRNLKFNSLHAIIPAETLRLFVAALESGRIARNFSKQIFSELITKISFESDLEALISDPRFKEVDAGDIETIVDKLINENQDQFEKARENPKLVQWFVGQAMKATQGKASAPVVVGIVNRRLAA